jgi:hypothetical protein
MEVTGTSDSSLSDPCLSRAAPLWLCGNLRSICRPRALSLSGKDATEDFEDVGHSDEARSMMAEKNDSGIKIVGKIEGEVPESMKSKASEDVRSERALPAVGSTSWSGCPFDLVTAAAARPPPSPSAPHCAAAWCGAVWCRAVPCRPSLPAMPHIPHFVNVAVPQECRFSVLRCRCLRQLHAVTSSRTDTWSRVLSLSRGCAFRLPACSWPSSSSSPICLLRCT